MEPETSSFVCDMDKGTICEFGNASAHDSEVVEVEPFLKPVKEFLNKSHVGTIFREQAKTSKIHIIW